MGKVSNVAKGKLARLVVFKGGKAKTASGMTKDKLAKSKSGKIVSKALSTRAKKAWASSPLKKWAEACKQARKVLGVKGFVAVGGKTAQGKALYAKVKSILAKWDAISSLGHVALWSCHKLQRQHLFSGTR